MADSDKQLNLDMDDSPDKKSGSGILKKMLGKLTFSKKPDSSGKPVKKKKKDKKVKPKKKEKQKKAGTNESFFKSKKKWLIIGISACLIVFACIGVYVYFSSDSPDSLEEELMLAELENSGEPVVLDFETILPLEKFSVTLPGEEQAQTLSMVIHLDFTTPDVLDELLDRTFELREAIETILVTRTLDEVRNINGKIILKEEIISTVNGFLKRGKIRDIYITEFIVM